MSVAFTKEQNYEAAAADLPDRPISPHPNLVTREGLAALDAALAEARQAFAAAQVAGGIDVDPSAMARAARDVRYFAARRASAELTEPKPTGAAIFGSRVTFERDDGRRQSYRIVGEDEAEPSRGAVSYVSPQARALMGKTVGDVATVAGAEIEILAVE